MKRIRFQRKVPAAVRAIDRRAAMFILESVHRDGRYWRLRFDG